MQNRIFYLLCVLLCLPLWGITQRGFSGQLTGGVVLAQIDGDRLAGYNKLGLQGGLAVRTRFNERWSMGLELLFTQQGSSRSLNDPAGATFEKIQLNLVEAPLLVYFADWKFEVGAGLSYARLINFSATDILGEDISNAQDFRNDLFFFNGDLIFNFSEQWAMGLRWSRALTNLQADSGNGTFLGKQVAIRGILTL